jgi:mono/diheme cytochrome c family protein
MFTFHFHSSLMLAVLLAGNAFAATASKGAAIYAINCASCHGAKAQGGIGPALQKHGNLTVHYSANWTAATFRRALLLGQDDHGAAFKAPMPTFGKVGFAADKGRAPTTAEIKAVQAYLRTIK